MERNEERLEVSKGCFLLSHSGRLFPQDTLQKIHSIHKHGKSYTISPGHYFPSFLSEYENWSILRCRKPSMPPLLTKCGQ